MDFSFLTEFKLSEAIIKDKGIKEVCKLKHNFFSLSDNDVKDAIEIFQPFPKDLKQFYQEIGFGFFHINRGRIHRILDPQSLIFINQQRDEYKRDKILAESIKEGQLVFLDSQAYGYFSLEMDNTQKGNAVYYKGEKVKNNLFDFINNFHKDRNYLKYMKDDAEEALKKKVKNKNIENKPVIIKESNSTVKTDTVSQNHPTTNFWSLLEDDDDNIII